MKRIILTATFLIALNIGSSHLFAQPPNPDGIIHNNTENQAAAPIGSGLALLIGLGAAYAGFRCYKNYERK